MARGKPRVQRSGTLGTGSPQYQSTNGAARILGCALGPPLQGYGELWSDRFPGFRFAASRADIGPPLRGFASGPQPSACRAWEDVFVVRGR